ncbi:MAG TPA: ATP-binding protein, partial [Longimicrobiales bacterium]
VPLPNDGDRAAFIDTLAAEDRLPRLDPTLSARTLAVLAAGLSLVDIEVLARSAGVSGAVLTAKQVGELKKRLIEKKCQGLVEFIEPKWGLDAVVGHEAAKARFREDARLLGAGHLDVLPMGYLVTGSVGTGKTFLAQCVAGQMNAPCVMLKNFRSKYVGESEGNLERVLAVLRAMGPVVVVVDEADAALGDRDAGGDSGTSQRLFAMIAAQMGDTRYRGRILWMLLTARPDRLPIDLKRQGRAEVHIPLFYPVSHEEIAGMFEAMARKLGFTLAAADVPRLEWGEISGADIEGILGRAWRRALLENRPLGPADVEVAFRSFLPSIEGGKKAHQKLAAILECTDLDFLPQAVRAWVEQQGGREALAASFVAED